MSQIPVQTVKGEGVSLPLFERVRRRAHELFRRRSNGETTELDDWLTAEREILGWASAEVQVSDQRWAATVALPGFEAKDVEVTATPEEIVIHATRSKDAETSEVYRCYGLPRPAVLDNVSARFEKGVLRVAAPFVQPVKPAQAAEHAKVAAA